MQSSCPCCSQKLYEECCKPFHQGKEPATPFELMRSRYSAYALNLPEYIQKTTHPKNPRFERGLSSIEEFCRTTEFCGLEILGHGPTHVYFTAHLKQQGRPFALTEKSRFEQVGSTWLYLDGEIFNT